MTPADRTIILAKLETQTSLMNVEELAQLLHRTPKTIYRRVRAGTIPSVKFGYNIRFNPQALITWLQESESH